MIGGLIFGGVISLMCSPTDMQHENSQGLIGLVCDPEYRLGNKGA